MTDTIITTERLILRKWRLEDIPAMAAINQDPIVMEHFPSLKTYAETEKFIQANIEACNEGKYSVYAVVLKENDAFIGFVGLSGVGLGLAFEPAVEIFWRIDSKYWGNGYAFEAARAVCDYAFKELGLKELVAFTVPANLRSLRLMDRLGFVHESAYDFEHPKIAEGHRLRQHHFYRLKKPNIN